MKLQFCISLKKKKETKQTKKKKEDIAVLEKTDRIWMKPYMKHEFTEGKSSAKVSVKAR